MTVPINSDKNFKEQFEKNKGRSIILFFTATWCAPCHSIKPFVEGEAEKNKDRLVVMRIDVDFCDETVEKYGITAMPTFVLLINGIVKYSFNGVDKGKFSNMIEKALE